MINASNVKPTNPSLYTIHPDQINVSYLDSITGNYLDATDDQDRYCDFLADKSRLEADLKSQHLFAISA